MAKLHFYYSAMNAGKTTTLLQSDYNYRERGMETLVFTPAIDDRYQTGTVSSRIGLNRHAHMFDDRFDFFLYTRRKVIDEKVNIRCVLIDEAHFLTKAHVEQLTRIADYLGIPVLAYGLRTDFTGEPFEGSKYLLAWAEELTEIKTICHCGKKATMNMRIDEEGHKVHTGELIEIGGNERYIATCRKHFNEGDAIEMQVPSKEFNSDR